MGSNSGGSTNAVDQLLGHTDGPSTVPSQEDVRRLQYSRQIVAINYTRLSKLCDNISTDGFVYFDKGETDSESLRINIFADIHNYLASLYSFVEELHQVIDKCVNDSINKKTFVRGSSRKDHSLPPFVCKLVFAWGLRNQFTHGNYRCLTVIQEQGATQSYMRVRFNKTKFDPRGQGDLQAVGDYLWGIDQHEENNPMCYFAKLNKHLLAFWTDTKDWFCRPGGSTTLP